LDYIKIRPFKIAEKILEVTYRLNLPAKMKIYLVQHIVMLEPAHKDLVLLVYEENTYRGQEEDEWLLKRIINYKKVNNKMWYKVL